MLKKSKTTLLPASFKHLAACASATVLLTTGGVTQAAEVTIGGYVKTDATYDLDEDLGNSLDASGVTSGSGTSSDPSFRMHSLQSRINASVTEGQMKAVIEGDFFTGDSSETVSNSRHFRLRHAYGQAGNLLIGQTWSTFMDKNWVLYPSTVDFGGPAGTTFVRQSQIRWSMDNGLDLALENPQNVAADASGGKSRDTLPDIVVRYASKGDLSWQIAGVFQQFEIDGGNADGESESNLGFSAGVAFNTGSGSISAKVNANANRYTYYGWANDSAVVVGNSIELIDHTAAVLAYNHNLGGSNDAKITIALGSITFDDEFLQANDPETISTVHANYRWSPYPKVNFGVEVSSASRENVNGDDGDATRLQFGAQYNF